MQGGVECEYGRVLIWVVGQRSHSVVYPVCCSVHGRCRDEETATRDRLSYMALWGRVLSYFREVFSGRSSKTMGPLGYQEMVFLFFLALILFGPKKLPELGRTVGKALTEFRRASNELKSTFDREMKSLEQETESFKEIANEYQTDTYSYDYQSYESTYEGAYGEP